MQSDRIISVRKLPFNVTVRYRATGRLIGRLELPDLSMFDEHPLVENGPRELPIAHHDKLLAVTDGWYYLLIDVERLAVVWKRLIDNNNVTSEPPLRFALSDDYLAVLKHDYDTKALYMIRASTGEVLWRTDPKDSNSPRPAYSMHIEGEQLFAIEPHAGQGYYVVGRNCETGEQLFRQEVDGYQAKPEVTLLPQTFGPYLVTKLADRQDFELQAFSSKDGRPVAKVGMKGVGPFGIPCRMSDTVQQGRLILMSKDELRN